MCGQMQKIQVCQFVTWWLQKVTDVKSQKNNVITLQLTVYAVIVSKIADCFDSKVLF